MQGSRLHCYSSFLWVCGAERKAGRRLGSYSRGGNYLDAWSNITQSGKEGLETTQKHPLEDTWGSLRGGGERRWGHAVKKSERNGYLQSGSYVVDTLSHAISFSPQNNPARHVVHNLGHNSALSRIPRRANQSSGQLPRASPGRTRTLRPSLPGLTNGLALPSAVCAPRGTGSDTSVSLL